MVYQIFGCYDPAKRGIVILDFRELPPGHPGREIGCVTIEELRVLDDYHNGEMKEIFERFFELEAHLGQLTERFLNKVDAKIPPVGKGEIKITMPSGAILMPQKKLFIPGS